MNPRPKQGFFDFSAPARTDEVKPPPPKANGQTHAARLKRRGQLTLFDDNGEPPPRAPEPPTHSVEPPALPQFSSGTVAKARDILAAIRLLKQLENQSRPATADEMTVLARFCGFGPVALHLFPDPITGKYKDTSWQALGESLRELLTVEEYDSAKRTTFNAFYTSPTVIQAMHKALAKVGVPSTGTVLEPGMGTGNFLAYAPKGMRFVGVELDSITGRIARALHPSHDIRIENFRDTKLPPLDGVIGNVPFADIKLEWKGERYSLHDYFFAKSLDAVKPGGCLALVTSHYTLDKQNAAIREHLAENADFLGAIRLPSDAFKTEGTAVVTDIVFLRKRAPGEPTNHCDPDWLQTGQLTIDGTDATINRYFLNHPEMVLGNWTRKDTLYGEGYSVTSNGDLADQLTAAIGKLPEAEAKKSVPQLTQRIEQPPKVAEGGFFLDHHKICQMVNGRAEPVNYGGKLLTSNGTLVGRRMACLIQLRDLARRVLKSQNEEWPEADRNACRRELNYAYDRFVSSYGAINKTTLSDTKDGTTIRRMPNLVKFREDPDAMLVMSLEEYDEATDKATKSQIMKKDVVGKTPPVTSVTSAEEGLLVSLNERGHIDMSFISSIYGKPIDDIVEELGNLIYLNPELDIYETADAYLSGNVRAKLKEAEATGFTRNAEALRKVQPEDVLPGDIDANLGAPWIPAADIQAFAAELFGVQASSIPIAHLKKDALWTVSPDYSAERSVPATADYGTPRANGTWLFELALNMKPPVIYDVDPTDPDKRIVNATETLAAKEKQKLIKEKFRAWVFSDPDRTERLVRLYNDNFNNLRPRLFDGSHLTFPGMNPNVSLNPHQTAAVWRCMTAGNTLLAHCVGAGKTYQMAGAAMKMKQAGIVKKPMIVVPNHLLEQFGREFMHLYPNAKLLIAGKDDFAKENRKLLTAKIASGDWDAVIVTHSSFERIGMSKKYQEEFLREQIAEYEALLHEHQAQKGGAHRNIIKNLEKQKANREQRLTELLAEDKKDDGLVFDELGVDQLFIDEFQYFKNLETPTKMDRVAGINTGGSERAFDVYMKARYLDQLHSGHGLVGASGTPISNSMVEMYTMQRYFDPAGLKERDIEHFDGWAATFGEVVEAMEISPDGKSLRPRSRFAKFINLPELQQMFRAFSDVQTADMLNLPRPKLAGGKPETIACPMSEDQSAIQQELVERYERLRSSKVDPREDNALNITTDGRKLALDARMLSGDAPDEPHSKVNELVENVYGIWKETTPNRSTQMIFCDMGVHPTPWGYSAYDQVISKLIAKGVPAAEIATIGDADTDAKKQVLFGKVRNGTVRILLGSTQKMGTGTNVQKKLVAMHHLDAPWKPAEVEQRDGRILRQGNENPEVAIYRYVTQGSFDSYMWQALETKAKFISQVMTGDNTARKAEDVGGQELSYAEVKAIASGNPAVLTLAETDAELKRLAILKKNHLDEQYLARRNVRDLPDRIKHLSDRLAALTADAETVDSLGNVPEMESVAARLDRLPEKVTDTRRVSLGSYRGLDFGIVLNPHFAPDLYLQGKAYRETGLSRDAGPRAVLNAAARLADSHASEIKTTQRDLTVAQSQLADFQARLGKEFEHEPCIKELEPLRDQLRRGLSEPPKEGEPTVAELCERIEALKSARVIVATPDRVAARVSAEEPVTARIKRQMEPTTEPEGWQQRLTQNTGPMNSIG
jgi:N12 class adenine-specific DNA methylase